MQREQREIFLCFPFFLRVRPISGFLGDPHGSSAFTPLLRTFAAVANTE
jgi:hypothetical protein